MTPHGRTRVSVGSSSRLRALRWAIAGGVAAVMAIGLSVPALAEAGPYRARLARDLAARLQAGSNEVSEVIVDGDAAKIDRLAQRYGLVVKRQLERGAVVELNGGQLDALSQDPEVDHLSSDLRVRGTAADWVEATGADQVWQGLEGLPGLTGRGVGVAVIDSGIANHPALRGRVVASVDFTGPRGRGMDQYGHGTHVAGIIAGSDPESGFSGMAPGADLINLRVLGADGSGTTSDVIDALDWAVAHRRQFNIRVINLSLGHPVMESYRDDPLCQAVERAVRAGIVVVAAAGNLGETPDGTRVLGGIESPGNSPWALTVGAIDTKGTGQRSDDGVADYSSRGPTYTDNVMKPDLVAPGTRIVSAAARGSYLWTILPDNQVYVPGSSSYLRLSGTSMAAAVATGAAALLLQGRPTLTPLQLRLVLQLTSSFLPEAGLIGGGAGSMNVLLAVAASRSFSAPQTLTIAGESANSATGIAFVDTALKATDDCIVWGKALVGEDCIVWGKSIYGADCIAWGKLALASDCIVWGKSVLSADCIVWGSATLQTDCIVWGKATLEAQSITWGQSTVDADCIVWGK
jgi:serine protease AprX